MEKWTIEDVEEIAHKIRDAFEEICMNDFNSKYPSDLCGYCQRASVQLFLEGKKRGMGIKMVVCPGHMYNLFQDYMVDITATQFGVGDRVLIQKRNCVKLPYWRPKPGGSCLQSLAGLPALGWGLTASEMSRDSKVVAKHLYNEIVGERGENVVAANG